MPNDAMHLACSECDFKAPDGNAFVDHVLMTGHTVDAETLQELKANPELLREYIQQLDHVVTHARHGADPPNAQRVSVDDEDLPEDVRDKFLDVEVRDMSTSDVIRQLAYGARVSRERSPRTSAVLREACRRLRHTDIDTFVTLVCARAEHEIATGKPREGAHHRALLAVQHEWKTRPAFPPDQEKSDV